VKLETLSKKLVSQLLKDQGLKFSIGLFNICLSSSVDEVADHLLSLYGTFEMVNDNEFVDFYVSVEPPFKWRRYLRPQVNFSFDGYLPFKPLPYAQASAMFEWGLNWSIANHSHQYLVIHAAVVERNSQAFIFPGTPGSGKSTLCAALIGNGWRLLSDEMTLLSINDGLIYPIPRPVSLKNQSIAVINDFLVDITIGAIVNDTLKGTVAHLRPPADSVISAKLPAIPAKIIFPKYQTGAITKLTSLTQGRALLKVAENSFNYNILGIRGFDCLAKTIDVCRCYDFNYSSLDEAVALFTEMSELD
jgi:HprK-related kinase A